MKWIPGAGTAEEKELASDYEKSAAQGKFRMGETYLFRKKTLGVWYLPWSDICWAYRQVEDVQSRLCCGTTNYEVEHLILVTQGGGQFDFRLEEKQDAQAVLDMLALRSPAADIGFSAEKKKKYEN